MNNIVTLRSKIDRSVNFIEKLDSRQAFECRYVNRGNGYFIAYVSSQSGCAQGCEMCHLTETKQTRAVNATTEELIKQLGTVLSYAYENDELQPHLCHVNFMARGEPLANPFIDDRCLNDLGTFVKKRGFVPKFLISTIMPRNAVGWREQDLCERFTLVQPEIYYSLYSTDPNFRKRWLPGAMEVNEALDMLKSWQDFSQKTVRIHHALIKDQNDSIDETKIICSLVNERNLHVHVNLVHYNPPNESSQEATDERYEQIAETYRSCLPRTSIVKVVPRVGFDVKASCGMFV